MFVLYLRLLRVLTFPFLIGFIRLCHKPVLWISPLPDKTRSTVTSSLFTAPAAVGKSTFARRLAVDGSTPLLDLASVPVSTHSLRGILSAEIGHGAAHDLQRGTISIIVDALDEGRVLSGDKNFEEFLRTSFQFLLEGLPTSQGQGPKILLFGRTEAADLASIVLELEAPEVPVTRLTIDYFDKESATTLALEYAKLSKGVVQINQYLTPIRSVINAFFDAIATAIGVPGSDLWQDQDGRAFAGYAPVLAALGTLIAHTANYSQLQQRLQTTGPADAWAVLEQVASEILDREAAKVYGPLADNWGNDVPSEAYDSVDQLDLLAAHLTGQTIRISPRLRFGSPSATAAYREAVGTHLPEHPFLRGGSPANDVLGAFVIAHAISQGIEVAGGQAPQLMTTYGRQPFLWRFLRGRLSTSDLIAGDLVSFILSSLWSDEVLGGSTVSVRLSAGDTGDARLLIVTNGEQISIGVVPPFVLRNELRDLQVDLPTDEIVLRGWPGTDPPVIRVRGHSKIEASTIRFEVERLHVGTLSRPASCHLRAQYVVNDERLMLEVQPKSILSAEGVFDGRYPWHGVAKPLPRRASDDPLLNLLVDCEQRLPNAITVVVLENYSPTHEPRTDWVRKHGDLFPRLLRALIEHGLATSDRISTSGEPKVRIRPNLEWFELVLAYKQPEKADRRLQSIFRQLG